MKKKKWYQAFSLVDDDFIAEAHPDRTVKPKRNKAWISILAACACFALLISNLWLFIPYNTTPPDVSKYADSEYFGLIQKLNVLTFQPPKYKNNGEKLWASITDIAFGVFDTAVGGAMPPTSAAPLDPIPENNYEEITDNQVAGIIEADRIKRSDTHIYYLDREVLRIYSIDKENTIEVGSYTLYEGAKYSYMYQWEFYLSADCNTVTVITQHYDAEVGETGRYVKLISLDVSDPANITKTKEFSITGSYMSSRLTEGSILLMTEFAISNLDFDNESSFLPQINQGNGFVSIPAEGIVSPEELNTPRYTVVMKLDEDTLNLEGTAAYLSYTDDVYVSENHVFLTRVFAEKTEDEKGVTTRNSMTEISCLTYGGHSFENKGSITLRGYVKDQWSMDEYEGILRVFTTTNATVVASSGQSNQKLMYEPSLQTATGQSNASLYCVDLSTFEVVASVIDFAPPREEIQSVRFDGDTAYVCTSVELSDPVFFFDLSDLQNITYKDTGTIEGFSTSLINLGNGYLLGIGRGNSWNSFKVEVYEETADGVRSVSAYELPRAEYSTVYKSYYINREHQLVGLAVIDWSGGNQDSYRYVLLHFDGYELVELVNVPLRYDTPDFARGVYIDGYMYILGHDTCKVVKVFN